MTLAVIPPRHTTDRKQQLLAYWRRQLEGAPPLLELPADRPRSDARTFTGADERMVVPPAIAAALIELSRGERVTLFVTLLAAFKALLSRYTGATDIIVGTSGTGRGRHEIEQVIGPFATTLVLRTDLSGNPSFRELLRRVRDVEAGAVAHQDLPFDQLVDALHPPCAPNHSPLCQVMFVLEPPPLERRVTPKLSLSQLAVDHDVAQVDLTVRLWETAGAIEGRVEYDAGLFATPTIRRLSRHFQRLLAGVASNADTPVGSLPLLGPTESRRVLREWNASPTRRRAVACVDDMFAAQVARTPDAYAVIASAERLTYAELAARAHRLAHHLAKHFAVGPEAHVAVCLDRGPDLVVAALAVWMAAGVYVPLDPAYPIERLRHVLATTEPRVVMCDAANAARLAAEGVSLPLLSLERDAPAIAAHASERPRRRSVPGNAAYMIYTSGSTGTPNGVVATHAALSHYVRAMGAACGVTPSDRYLHTASFGFSSSIRQLMVPLTHGAAIVIATASELADPIALFHAIDAHGATIADWVPSHWRQCAETLKARSHASPAVRPARTLRLVLAASEPLPIDLPGAWDSASDADARAEAINMFGQTETTGIAAMYRIRRQDPPAAGRFVPIGRPIANVRMYVLDRMRHPVPPGVTGEIYIGGPTLARGYWRQPALTAERFVPDPFGPPGARLYRCGDLGRHGADGTLEFLGRVDQQVKIRGFRVELGEIEAQLVRHPSIREAVVAAHGEGGDRRLAAYVVPTRMPAPPVHEWRSFLQARVPAYMVPASFVVMDALPRTSTNKVDRRALPPVSRETSSDGADATGSAADGARAPRTPTEERLLAIWQETLQIGSPSVDDNFFACGGHSLAAMQVVSRIRDAFRIELPIHAVFEAPTIAALGPIVDALRASSDWMTA